MSLRIAIIGCGPAGCMLARLLLHQGVPNLTITIFEAEVSDSGRAQQGGTLDLHQNTGIRAIKQAGLYREFLESARFDGSFLDICDKRRTTYFMRLASKPGSKRGSPEIDRSALRLLLIGSLPTDMIRWDHRLESIDPDDHTLYFSNAAGKKWTESGFGLIVGADGAWSRVRTLLSQVKPVFTGIRGYNLIIKNTHNDSTIEGLINRGSVFAFSDGKAILGQRIGDGSVDVSIWIRAEEDWPEHGQSEGEAARSAILNTFHDWDDELLNLIKSADGNRITPRSLYMLPPGFQWQTHPGITLIGDAAHLMPPFAGEGVNMAFQDALALADAISKVSKDRFLRVTSGIAKYEQQMAHRATKAQAMTCGMMRDMMFKEGAPRRSIETFLIRRAGYDVYPWLYPLVYPFLVLGVYSFYFAYKLFIW